jgi:2',3'-cyclic-nucleotide 2'-phosphodiesterase (5'-nucleotidase family)
MRVTLLHSNDIHGRLEGLARIATIVERVRAETPHRVIYVDAGDVEETTSRLSNLTNGVAMHRLLSAAGCEVAAVGNAAWLRYGIQVVAAQARAADYPLLLANLSRCPERRKRRSWTASVFSASLILSACSSAPVSSTASR